MTVKAVWFDLDDTLLWDERSVRESLQAAARMAAERTGADPEAVVSAVERETQALYESFETYPFTQMIGINRFEALWARFEDTEHPMFAKLREIAPIYRNEAWTRALRAVGADDPGLGAELAARFMEERRRRPYLFEDALSTLDRLRLRFRLLLLTNGSPSLQREKLAGVPELASYFDHIVISGAFGEGKPSPRLFRHAMDLHGVTEEETVMVGDRLTTDILGAGSVGMRSVWVNRRGVPREGDIVPTWEIRSLAELPALLEKA
jgi:putative hydrolase of the HAD superfamily